MSLKIHFLHNHLNFFERQLASESDEHGERFHQIAMPMEVRYRGKKIDAMIADICWWSYHKFEKYNDEEIIQMEKNIRSHVGSNSSFSSLSDQSLIDDSDISSEDEIIQAKKTRFE